MILFGLQCSAGHRFEAWFKDGASYESQKDGDIACPVCGDTAITKAPMAPRIAKTRGSGGEERLQALKGELMRQLSALHKEVRERCDYVGDRFAEEARRIHYGETETRDIYGEASEDDATALTDEGITIYRVPRLPKTDS